jgi:trigger factor
LSTIAEVREAIKEQYDREIELQYSDIKFRACCDALLARLSGEVPQGVLDANVEAVRQLNLDRLSEMHMSMEQFLREENLTPDQYDEKLRRETLYNMRLNVALDIMADVLGMQVGNHELTEYLSTPDPEAFIREIREKDQVEEARRAAVRVKAMRRIVDTAIVEEEGGPAPAVPVASPEPEEDVEMPDFDNLPIPRIRDANPGGFSIIAEDR